jgi:endonuclease/exonuclease/phosphatase family metal-dependent hydrolase
MHALFFLAVGLGLFMGRLHASDLVDPQKSINVMTFNVRYGLADDGKDSWEYRKGMVCEVIKQHSPDLIGLQEALRFQMDEILKNFPEYAESGKARDGDGKGEYSALLYRRDRFDVLESNTFWLSDTPDVPSAHWGNHHLRICTWARFLDKASNSHFYFYNTHLDHQSQPAREKGVGMIAQRIHSRNHPDPFILTGDFNAGEDNPAITYLKGESSTLGQSPIKMQDSYRVIHPSEKVVGTFNGFKGTKDRDKIDYVFISEGWQVKAADIVRYQEGGHTPSDHFPVKATIRISSKE